MSKVALVTGGTRGIGAAISLALKAQGRIVAANYAGNDEAAAAFKAETGIPVFKFDVGSFDACAEGVARIAAAQDDLDAAHHRAGTPGIGDASVFYFRLDAQVAFNTGDGVDYNAGRHKSPLGPQAYSLPPGASTGLGLRSACDAR